MNNIKLYMIIVIWGGCVVFSLATKIEAKNMLSKMEKQKEKIKQYSKIVYILLNIAIGVVIAISIIALLTWPISGLNLPTEIVNINGMDTEMPYLFKLGETHVYLPTWQSGFDFSGIQAVLFGLGLNVGAVGFFGCVFTIIGLWCTRRVFKLLRENGSPFREDVVKALKRLAIVLLFVGFASGVVAFLVAGIVWALCLIFDYGCALQNESDTTL
jgi:hypothetical protein